MTSRFDFDYWPPVPIEQPPILPAQSAPSEELSRGLLLIQDDERRRAVYATDEWVDIEDFWIETLSEPKAEDIWMFHQPDASKQLIPPPLRVSGRRYLQNATYTFHRMAYELAAREPDDLENEHPLIKTLDKQGISRPRGDTRVEGFLFHHVFASWDKRFSNQQILIARTAVDTVLDGSDYFPAGLGKDGRAILAKVALRWHRLIQNKFVQ